MNLVHGGSFLEMGNQYYYIIRIKWRVIFLQTKKEGFKNLLHFISLHTFF